MLPMNSGLTKPEHVAVFCAAHLAHDGMTDLRLQFADKAIKDAHLDNRHKAQLLQTPAMARDRIKGFVENVETSVGAGFPLKIVNSHVRLSAGEFGQGLASVNGVGGFRFQSHTVGRNLGEVNRLSLVLDGAT